MPHIAFAIIPYDQDFKNTPAAHFCMPIILTHRMLIGVFIGGMSPRPSPNAAYIREMQTQCLIGVSAVFFGYLVIVRPYHVGLANLFEALVPVEIPQNTFSSRARCIATATARSLIHAECSAVL